MLRSRLPVKVVLKRIAPLMHPNRLQFKRLGGLSWPACPCGTGDGPLYFWGAHLAKLSPFTWRKERNGQVVLKRMETRPNHMGQIRPTCNKKRVATHPGDCPGPTALSLARTRGVWEGFSVARGGPKEGGKNEWLTGGLHSSSAGSGEGRNSARVQQVHSFHGAVPVSSSVSGKPPSTQCAPRQRLLAEPIWSKNPA